MRRPGGWWLPLVLLALSAPTFPAGEPSASKVQGTTIAPEAVALKPGGGLSYRTPVARPLPLRGVRSWTVETRRHRWAAIDLALSPDGTVLATGGYDGMVRLWDTASGALKRVLVGHESYVYGLAWTADGRYLASAGSHDLTVRIWEAGTGLPVRVLRGIKDVPIVVAWSPDGSLLAAGTGGSGYVPVWRIAGGKLIDTAETGKPVVSLAFSPDGVTLACGVSEAGVTFLSGPRWKAAGKIELAGHYPRGLSYSADGKELAVGTSKQLVIWDTAGHKVLRRVDAVVSGLARHGKRLATASSPGMVWNPDAAKPLALPAAQAAAWSGDGKAIYLLAGDEIVRVEPDKAVVQKRWSVAESGSLLWGPGRPVLSGIGTPKPRLFDATTGKLLHALEGHTVAVAAWSPGGKVLATGSYDKRVRVWNPATGKLLRTLGGMEAAVTALAVAGDGRVAAGTGDGKIHLFAAEAVKPLRTYAGHGGGVRSLAWAANGRLASGGPDAVIHVWGTDAKKPVRSLEIPGSAESLAFSPSGKWLAAGAAEDRIHVWSYPGGKLLHELSSPGSPPAVTALAWSPDSAQLIGGRANHTVQLWDVKTGKQRHSFVVMAPVHAVAWAAVGKTMVTCTIDRSVRFWNVATGQIQATLMADGEQLCCVATEGHYRVPDEAKTELVCVALTAKGMETLTLKKFAARYGWKNNPARARMVGR